MTDPDRQTRYDEIRERFVADPEFREALRADPAGVLDGLLGGLTDEEQGWVADLPDASTSDDEIVDQVRSGGLGAW